MKKIFMLTALCLLAFPATSLAAPFQPREVPFQRGMTLSDWGKGGYPEKETRVRLDQFKKAGVQWVTLLQVWTQKNLQTNTIYPSRQSVSDRRLVAAIRYARSIGLQVLLRPYIDPADGRWRGLVRASNPDQWFASYEAFALRYARIAKYERVGMFVFASEMGRMSMMYPRRWSRLAARVRDVFPGPVSYESNWGETLQARWLGSLDAISISAYYPICGKHTTDVKALQAGWKKWMPLIGKKARSIRRPVVFTEVGYRPVNGTCKSPWSNSLTGPLNLQAQANAYEATLRSWWGVPWFRGMHWWTMKTSPTDYSTKPHAPAQDAWSLISEWYAKPSAADSRSASLPVLQRQGLWSETVTPPWKNYLALGLSLFTLLLLLRYRSARR